MSPQLQQAISAYLHKGYQIAEQLAPTSVALRKKRLIGSKWVYLWTDDHSNVQVSEQSLNGVVKKLCEIVRLRRTLQGKVSCAFGVLKHGRHQGDLFNELLVSDYSQDVVRLVELKGEESKLEKEISLRNCLGSIALPLRQEVERCLREGYELKSHTASSAILWRRSPCLSGPERLNLSMGAAGKVQRSGESCASLQSRLDTLISLYKMYRTGRPTPGREKQVLDKQFELDAEINALCGEMKYLGYAPNVGDYIL